MITRPEFWVGTSWKMNKTQADALAFADALLQAEKSIAPAIQPFVVPPFTSVRAVKAALSDTRVLVGAQNMHWQDAGAWTGEISGPMLTECGLDLVELGHSERRAHFGETDEIVGLKVAAAVRNDLLPLVCIGETLADKDAGQADAVLARQVTAALSSVGKHDARRVLFAYEPVWAIGEGGVPASADYANARQEHIKSVAAEITGVLPPCLYGGSVTLENSVELITQPMVDGLFIGRAAWQVEGYLSILRRCAENL